MAVSLQTHLLNLFIEKGGFFNKDLIIKKDEIKNKILVFYCAIGERSALAIQVCLGYKIKNVYHLVGGINNV